MSLWIINPPQNQIIIDVPKNVLEFDFSTLSKHFSGKVFLDHDRKSMELYVVITQKEAVIVSQTAEKKIERIDFSQLEYILVDLLIEK